MVEKKQAQSSLEYKGCKIEVEGEGAIETLKIDGQSVAVHRDADTGTHASSEAPYQEFGSLEELGKAIVDCRQEEA